MTFLDFWLENRESASLIVGASEVVHSSLTSNTNSMSNFIRIRRNRELPAMPTSQRTNEFFSLPSLALTNDSSFGDLLLLSPGWSRLPEIRNTFVQTSPTCLEVYFFE